MNPLVWTVFRKEMKDMVRDRRMLMAAFSFVFVTPIFMLVIAFLISDDRDSGELTPLAVANADAAPGLVVHLRNAGFDIRPVEAPAALSPDSIRIPKDADAGLLVIPEAFQDQLSRAEPIALSLFQNASSRAKISDSEAVQAAIANYGRVVASTRFIVRGVPLVLATPFTVEMHDISEKSLGAQILTDGFVMIFLLAPFASSMSVAVDTLAGERERQSLQTLIAQPVSAWALVLGKFLMVATFGMTGAVLSLMSMSVLLLFMPQDIFPIIINTSPVNILLAILQMLPLALFAAALQVLISISVKSFKEGQSYMSLVLMAPMMIAYVKIYGSDKLPEGANYLPMLSNMEGLSATLFRGEFLGGLFVISAGVALLGTAVLLSLTARRLSHERLLNT